MNKKYFIFLSTIPLIASCHGVTISKDEAKVLLNDLSIYLNEVDVDQYPLESFIRKGESFDGINKVVTKSIYSKDKMFYYSYSVNYPVDETKKVLTIENWIYGWTNQSDNSYNIYYVLRDSGGDYLPFPGRESMEDKYSTLEDFNKAWGKVDEMIEKETVIADTLIGVGTMMTLIDFIEGDEYAVKSTFQSSDKTSIYYEGNYDTVGVINEVEEKIYNYHTIDIYSAKINSFSYEYYGSNKEFRRYNEFSYKYESPEIVYPKIN